MADRDERTPVGKATEGGPLAVTLPLDSYGKGYRAYDAHAFKYPNRAHARVVGHIEPLTAEEETGLAGLTPAERSRYFELSRDVRRVRLGVAKRPLSLREFVDRISGGKFKWYTYALVLASVLQEVADGLRKRVMVYAPPRHGKSELTSRYFPAYYLYRHPEQWVALVSYGATLANRLSRAARDNYFAFHQRRATGAVNLWLTGQGGGCQAAGSDGSLTGSGFHLGIIDDPIKNAEEASSEKVRNALKEWWQSTFWTRAEPDAAIVIIQTRWNEDDLAGWLLAQEWDENAADDAEPERWHIVNFEAIRSSPAEIAKLEAQDGRPAFPPTCTLEPDWREPGEALNPLRYPAERLLRTRRRVGPYYWAALYQQRPRPKAGLLFKIDKIQTVDAIDVPWTRLLVIRYWDKAASESDGSDYTVGSLLGYDPSSGLFYILDCVRGQWSAGKRDLRIRSVAQADAHRFSDERLVTWGEQEPGAAGLDMAISFRTMLVKQGRRAYFERPTGAKTDRADPFAAAVDLSLVRMLRAPWNGTVRRELADFPHGQNDDIVDTLSGAYNKHARRHEPDDMAPSVSRRSA